MPLKPFFVGVGNIPKNYTLKKYTETQFVPIKCINWSPDVILYLFISFPDFLFPVPIIYFVRYFNITETFRSFFDGCTDITAQLKIVPSYNIFGIIWKSLSIRNKLFTSNCGPVEFLPSSSKLSKWMPFVVKLPATGVALEPSKYDMKQLVHCWNKSFAYRI